MNKILRNQNSVFFPDPRNPGGHFPEHKSIFICFAPSFSHECVLNPEINTRPHVQDPTDNCRGPGIIFRNFARPKELWVTVRNSLRNHALRNFFQNKFSHEQPEILVFGSQELYFGSETQDLFITQELENAEIPSQSLEEPTESRVGVLLEMIAST